MKQVSAETPAAALRTLRMIGMALAAGVFVFAGVAWTIRRGDPGPAGDPVMLYLWIAFATSLLAGAMVTWRGQVVPHLRPRHGAGGWRQRATKIQTGLIITWALIEAAAIFGVVVYLLAGHGLAGAAGVLLMWGGLVLTWPQSRWLEGEGEGAAA